MNKVAEKKQSEIDFQCDWMLEIIKYHIENGNPDYESVLNNIEYLRKLGKTSYIRENYNDINSMALEEMDPELLPELNRRLKEKFGKTLWDVNKKMETKINNIAQRGSLRNEGEFYLVKNYIDTITDIPEKEMLCNTLEKMTFDFEMKL